jgi:phosphohistidine phosphatase
MIAKALQKLNTRFDLVMTSPYIRARETADIIVRITRFRGDIEEDRRLVPMARYEQVSTLITERADATSMLLVGHQPAIGEFIGGLCAGSPIDIEVIPASVRLIEISQFRPLSRGTLIWTLTPTVVEAIMS